MQDWEIKEKQQKQQWCNWKLKTENLWYKAKNVMHYITDT